MKLKLDENGNVVVVDGKPVYVHDDGKEVPFDAPGTVATISRLNGEAKSHREAKEAAEASLKKFAGIEDPEAAIKAIQTIKNFDDKKLVDAGEVEKVKAEAIKALEDKYAPIVSENEKLHGQINDYLIGGAFNQSKFISENFAAQGPAAVDIARSLFAKNLKVEDGKVVGYDANGQKIYSKSNPGELASADEAIEAIVGMYPHKDHILKSSGKSGSGSQGGGNGGGGGKTASRDEFNAMDPAGKAQFMKDGGSVTE